MPRNKCVVCLHPDRPAIDSKLTSGEQLKALALNYGISPHSLSRHRARHLITTPVSDNAESLQAQINLWRERADQLWQCATADADVRGQAQAVAAGLRSCESQMRQIEREAETVAKAGDEGQIDIRAIDCHVQKVIAAMATLQADSILLRIAAALVDEPRLYAKAVVVAEREKNELVSQNRTN